MIFSSSLTICLLSAACIFAGALLGLFLRDWLPEAHLRDNSKDTVKVTAGMISTLAALVLGLLVGSAKSSFDAMNTAITESGAKAIMLDRVLATYGPETRDERMLLRGTVAHVLEIFWPEESTTGSGLAGFEHVNAMESLQAKLRLLTPTSDTQRQLLSQAEQISEDLLQARWLLIEQAQTVLPIPFLVILLFWLTMLHLSFGLFASRNATVIAALLASTLSVSAALFVVLEMSHPLEGMIKASSAPIRKALEHMGE